MKILTWKILEGTDRVINKCIDRLIAGGASFEVGDTVEECLQNFEELREERR